MVGHHTPRLDVIRCFSHFGFGNLAVLNCLCGGEHVNTAIGIKQNVSVLLLIKDRGT